MKPKRPVSRFVRTLRALFLIGMIGVVLGVYNAYTARRDRALALGPEGPAQERFFVQASERPDLAAFFKSLKPEERVRMAQNIGRYDEKELAKLIGISLGDFHAPAREALTESLAKVAKAHPAAVAEQLKLTGSFQSFGVSRALRTLGPTAVTEVVKQLEVGDARNNAVTFLVETGVPAVPALIRSLDSENADVRKAAADGLGKIGSPLAREALTRKYHSTEGEEQQAYLASLSSIGAPESEELFTKNLDDETYTLPRRAVAALGLGRIGSPAGVARLWRYAEHPDLDFRASILSALQLAGDVALRQTGVPAERRMQVAARVATPYAEGLIREGLRSPNPSRQTILAAEERPALAGDLAAALRRVRNSNDGAMLDRLVAALMTTDPGRKVLEGMQSDPILGGLIARRLTSAT